MDPTPILVHPIMWPQPPERGPMLPEAGDPNAPRDSYDQVVVRGDLAKREFVAFWARRRTDQGTMNVNVWDVIDQMKPLIACAKQVDTDRLADPDVPLHRPLSRGLNPRRTRT